MIRTYEVSIYDKHYFFLKKNIIFYSWWDYIKFRIKYRNEIVLVHKTKVK